MTLAARAIKPYVSEAERTDSTIFQLDAPRLACALGEVQEVETLAALRAKMAFLRSRIEEGEFQGPSVSLSRRYVLEEFAQVCSSLTIDRAKYYVARFVKGLTVTKTNAVNDLNLARWKECDDVLTDSLWMFDKRDSSGVHSAGYWGNFIPQIPHQMMRRYTKAGDWVLDTFAGSGTTLIEAQRLGRNSIGIELQPSVAEQARQNLLREPNRAAVTARVFEGDSTEVDYAQTLGSLGRKNVQLVMMHPPYHDIIKFSEDPRCLSNADGVDAFLASMGKLIDNVSPVLEKGRYLALVIGDKYSKRDWIPLGFLTMAEFQKRGFSLRSLIVKNFEETAGKRQQNELWRYRALVGGFYIFKHEYIFVFSKGH